MTLGWPQSVLPVYYTWVNMYARNWNQFIALKDSSGAIKKFDLSVAGGSNVEANVTTFLLDYSGSGS